MGKKYKNGKKINGEKFKGHGRRPHNEDKVLENPSIPIIFYRLQNTRRRKCFGVTSLLIILEDHVQSKE